MEHQWHGLYRVFGLGRKTLGIFSPSRRVALRLLKVMKTYN